MLPSDLTLSALRFILSAKSRQSRKQDCETVDFYNSLYSYCLDTTDAQTVRPYSGLHVLCVRSCDNTS